MNEEFRRGEAGLNGEVESTNKEGTDLVFLEGLLARKRDRGGTEPNLESDDKQEREDADWLRQMNEADAFLVRVAEKLCDSMSSDWEAGSTAAAILMALVCDYTGREAANDRGGYSLLQAGAVGCLFSHRDIIGVSLTGVGDCCEVPPGEVAAALQELVKCGIISKYGDYSFEPCKCEVGYCVNLDVQLHPDIILLSTVL